MEPNPVKPGLQTTEQWLVVFAGSAVSALATAVVKAPDTITLGSGVAIGACAAGLSWMVAAYSASRARAKSNGNGGAS